MAWQMTRAEKRYDKQAAGVFKQKYGKKRRTHGLSKAERQEWWSTRTEEQKQAFIAKKQAQKAKRRSKDGLLSTCKVFPVIDSSNRKEWQRKVLRMNPWLDPDIFEPVELEDQGHMQSIAREIRSA